MSHSVEACKKHEHIAERANEEAAMEEMFAYNTVSEAAQLCSESNSLMEYFLRKYFEGVSK